VHTVYEDQIMTTSLKQGLGSSGVGRPIGSHVWFPNVDNPTMNPIYETPSSTYLRSGYLMTNEQQDYPELFSRYGVELPNDGSVWVSEDNGLGRAYGIHYAN